jgi:ABC-type glycerol-3-phosphate transport system substrate-binding protein
MLRIAGDSTLRAPMRSELQAEPGTGTRDPGSTKWCRQPFAIPGSRFPVPGSVWLLGLLFACGSAAPAAPPIRFLSTFGAEETELFNQILQDSGLAVESSLVPFARGQQVITEILRAGSDCPDLIRIDATWLPGLVGNDLLAAVPGDTADPDWTPEAVALARGGTASWRGLPQTVDGLVVLRTDAQRAPASPALADLIAAARASRTDAVRMPLTTRVDGYWLVPWLRAAGVEIAIDALDQPAGADAATGALAAYAKLFGDLVPPPPPAGSEPQGELRRWTSHEIAYWITGPWQLASLPDRDHVAVSALAHAPRGGQLLVVPRCARRPDAGWRLADELTSTAVELKFATAFGTVPTRRSALAAAPPLVRAVHEALHDAEPLPASPTTPLLFDDLNPALAAVVDGDATAAEAIAGVRHGWQRLEGQGPDAHR